MPDRRTSRLTAAVAIALGLCAAGGGCNTFPHSPLIAGSGQTTGQEKPRPQAVAAEAPTPAFTRVAYFPRLQPRSELQWSVESADSRQPMTGHAVVGPDGTAVLGPYGAYAVGGLTADEARRKIEQQLASHLRSPKVQLTVAEVAAADWRPAAPVISAQTPQVAQAPAQSQSGVWRAVQHEDVRPAGLTTPATDAPAQLPVATPRSTSGQFGTAPGLRPMQVASNAGPALAVQGEKAGPALGGEAAPAPRSMQKPPPIMVANNGPMVMPGHVGMCSGNAPNEAHRISHPTYIIGPPDILQIDSLEGLLTQPVRGPHLVRPDGTVGVGTYGSVYVAGMTIDQARVEIAKIVHARLDPNRKTLKDVIEGLSVDVLAYNSKVYYVITDRIGFGEIVQRFPITGNETVLDAIANIQGLPPEASRRRVWVARRTPDHAADNVLPVDWVAVSQKGQMGTNYQLLPGDRVYVKGQAIQRLDTGIARILSPIQRVLGAMLLGSETYNSIKFHSP